MSRGQVYANPSLPKTHGYFIQMGGFSLYDGSFFIGVLGPEQLKARLRNSQIVMPTITEKEINDRSKGDGLSKTIVLMQTVWFIAQCIARKVEGLDFTELEPVTLAYAALNSIMYAFWWNKPLNVQTTVPGVYLLPPPLPTTEAFENTPKSAKERPESGEVRPKPLAEARHESAEARPDSAVGTFYADYSGSRLIGMVFPVVGVLFGSIHCAGWHLSFISPVERKIWRACSIAITAIPAIGLVYYYFHLFVDILVAVLPPIYVLARVALLVEAVIALRNLQPGVLPVVEWTSFLPHI
ncbi:hypothetical protein GALMADRAFT_57570 [Galerina marginata CBS 339.88]|uniref:Uncharacterized protein n=1 Tax=Galerina marginata (strain CBS 339.88) TaxID=685588 RepID=A0A067TTQ2_GALM3|nr:hypothetical protein GALMADRAFT_57570 [Galerina marginata CBS 339.88]